MAEMRFLRPCAGYKIMDNKYNEDITEEMRIREIKTMTGIWHMPNSKML
jgi:hypothetical protein